MGKNEYKKSRIKVLLTLLLCLVFVAQLTPKVYADEETMAISTTTKSNHRTVRVAFPSQGSMGEVGRSGDLKGYNYSFLQKLAQYLGWNLEYITYDGLTPDQQIIKAMEMVMSGEADLLGPILYSESVADMFEFPENNYGVVYTTLCALENSNITSVNLDTINPIRVAVYKGATSRNKEISEYLMQLGYTYEFIECDTAEDQLEALKSGSADLVSGITLSYFDGTRTVAQFAPRPYYYVSTKGNTELMSELDDAISAMNYAQPYAQQQLQQEFYGDTSGGYILTDEEKTHLERYKKLEVLCAADYAPYCRQDDNGEKSGILISLLNDFASENQLDINYTFCDSTQKLESEWETGNYDCIIGLPFTDEYCVSNEMIKTTPVVSVGIVLFGKQGTQKEDSESTIAVYDQLASTINVEDYKEVIFYPTIKECYDAVENGKADYGYANRLGVDYQIIERNSTFVCKPILGYQVDVCIAVQRQSDYHLLAMLNKYIHTLEDSRITGYISEASKHIENTSIITFVKNQPMIAVTLFTIIGLLIISTIMLYINARINKKRNIKLVEANSAKSEFLSRMSHDIRTPMNAILGFADLGKQDMDNKEKLEDDFGKITSSGKFLLGLVNDVLDMTKIESKAMKLNLQPYSRKEFSTEIDSLIRPLCNEKNITLTVNLAHEKPQCVYADKLRINQIFFNLLSNAVKYTPENGHIWVSTRNLGDENGMSKIEFMVRDDGIGMSDEFQKQMFDAFSQEQQHITGKEGTGLGLAIVKSLVELMNGTIDVKSATDEGSTFTVVLPLMACDCELVEEKEEHTSTDCLKDKRVLLCEDQPINTQLAIILLQKAGMEVTVAENGKIGVEKFTASSEGFYDIVLMDIRMPVMDGLEATKAIRKLDRSDAKKVPILAVTANAFDSDIQICREAGMNGHMSKPYDKDKMYKMIADSLEGDRDVSLS